MSHLHNIHNIHNWRQYSAIGAALLQATAGNEDKVHLQRAKKGQKMDIRQNLRYDVIILSKGECKLKLKKGDKYEVNTGRPNHIVSIEITKLGSKKVEFMMRGEGVVSPDKPRVLEVDEFEEWLSASPYWKA